ncbi:hypothetical protein GLAREA_09621 [Glarea lozoyensis ATCC 20868]|uniref:N-acetyltransferase domain-containing protein n=1 Tax=Glarea lozoyensis (strain ATCC 20868 / MF5171) TaxID=1116229 RepID=S3CS45_GLAL2|nr:uncharacterized protein GLAREA_09621 [Glarea lozoyensis ATCC 20868]EPE28500.1 hypothetical protein GLAREA_09621 [Glarea lozoyensis ATCC 20868]
MARHVPQLDLRNTLVGSIEKGINIVPGLRTSTAFFTFLRANLVLPSSTLNSNTNTPLLSPYSSQYLPPLHTLPPSSLSIMSSSSSPVNTPSTSSTPPSNPLDSIPPLTTTILTTDDDKTAALKLVADSIAQQRQAASKAIIFHPLTLAIYAIALGIVTKLLYKVPNDIGIVFTTCAGITMAGMIAIRGAVGGYLSLAEELKWSFLKNDSGEEDIVLGSRFGDNLIGALILRLERNPPSPTFSTAGKKKGSGNSRQGKTGGQGVIRAWTVGVRFRGKGVGTELLEEAVKSTREKLGGSAEVGFAREHANSKMVVPEIFNGGFRKREARAARALEKVVGESRKR